MFLWSRSDKIEVILFENIELVSILFFGLSGRTRPAPVWWQRRRIITCWHPEMSSAAKKTGVLLCCDSVLENETGGC